MKTIELSGDVGFEITAKGLKDQLGNSREAVKIKVDSYGGSVFEAVRLYNAIKDYKGKTTVELGAVAASAASFFPLAADRIEARKNTTYMGHKAWSFAIGNSDDMIAESLILEGLDNLIADTYAKKTGKKKKDILEDMRNEFWLFGGDDIVASGFADAVTPDDEDQEDEPMERPEVAARLEQVKHRLEESESFNNEMKRAAKLFDVKNTVEEIVQDPSLTDNIILQEDEMSLSEILAKNPEAKAEHETLLKNAKAEGKEAGKQEEIARVSKLVDKAKSGIGNSLERAIIEGMSYEEFCVLEYETGAKAAAAPKQDIGSFNPEPATPKAVSPEKSKAEKELEAADRIFGGEK